MTDLKRHSEGIWRSIYIFAPIEDQWEIKDFIEPILEKLKLKEWSYCHYGSVTGPCDDLTEEAHITYRISFPGTSSYDSFRRALEKGKWRWEDHGYDEPLWVKRAYVVGTKLYKGVLEATRNPDVPLNFGFLQLMFHGFFNDLHYNSKQEAELYLDLFLKYLAIRYGIKHS